MNPLEGTMSEVPMGAGARGAVPDVDVPAGRLDPAPASVTYPEAAGGPGPSTGERAKHVAKQGKESAAQAAGELTSTAKEQAQRVAREAGGQARSLASDVRDRVGEQARSQNDRLVGTIRQTADQLDEMRGDRADSPAAAVVSRVAEGGRQFADYLDRNGPEGVLREVQDFARRRPGAFLATALAAGFVVGRLGKSIAKAGGTGGQDKTGTDEFVSRGSGPEAWSGGPGTTLGTEYATTGTGIPAVVAEDYVADRPGGPR
jgi:hypothetical protein